jgi:hypothetical protein
MFYARKVTSRVDRKKRADINKNQKDVMNLFGRVLSCCLEDCSRGVIGEASSPPQGF